MRLAIDSIIPSFDAPDLFGQRVNLAELRGRPVLLSFYRYASCPVCNLRVHSIILSHPKWSAQGLVVVAVFQSPADSIKQYVGRQDAPFAIVPDPEMDLYRRFGVESRWSGLLSWRVMMAALSAFGKGFLPGRIEGPVQRTPADFLIDAQGRIALAHYGKDIDDHIPLETITQWLNSQHS